VEVDGLSEQFVRNSGNILVFGVSGHGKHRHSGDML
jgi:hypothetical protein